MRYVRGLRARACVERKGAERRWRALLRTRERPRSRSLGCGVIGCRDVPVGPVTLAIGACVLAAGKVRGRVGSELSDEPCVHVEIAAHGCAGQGRTRDARPHARAQRKRVAAVILLLLIGPY